MKKLYVFTLVLTACVLLPFQALAKPKLVIAVLDTGLDLTDIRFKSDLCPTGHKDFTDTGLKDTMGHGTHVAGLIATYGASSGFCMVIVKYYTEGKNSINNYIPALKYILEVVKPNIINISGGGNYDSDEEELIKTHPNITFITAAGNEGRDLNIKGFYPASLPYRNIIVVGNLNSYKHDRNPSSNFGAPGMTWEVGTNVLSMVPGGGFRRATGTSQACAIVTGKYARAYGKLH